MSSLVPVCRVVYVSGPAVTSASPVASAPSSRTSTPLRCPSSPGRHSSRGGAGRGLDARRDEAIAMSPSRA
ncbi:unnamed protein product [Leptosia nina]|uniref:Uncharacterized protein n=1 Tax=Leptosia nina TaxID=320188 RepID=A0AAV1JV49_9NEOP